MSFIPTEIAKASLNDLKLRAQLRLFYWFKTNMPDRFYLTDEVKKEILKSFSRYEFKNHFQGLLDRHFISVDKNGKVYLRGRNYYKINFNLKNKKFRSDEIPEKVLTSRNAWIGFIDGCCIDSVHRSANKGINNKEKKRVTASRNWGAPSSDRNALTLWGLVTSFMCADVSMDEACKMANLSQDEIVSLKKMLKSKRSKTPPAIPISLEMLMPLGRSRAGAAKMRKRAAAAGWITNEQQLQLITSKDNPKGIKVDRKQYLEHRGLIAEREGAALANKIIWKKGYLYTQLPNLVSSKMNSRCQRF